MALLVAAPTLTCSRAAQTFLAARLSVRLFGSFDFQLAAAAVAATRSTLDSPLPTERLLFSTSRIECDSYENILPPPTPTPMPFQLLPTVKCTLINWRARWRVLSEMLSHRLLRITWRVKVADEE